MNRKPVYSLMTLALLLAAFCVAPIKETRADGFYLGALLGGEFAGGDAYSGRDPRFAFGFEMGGPYFALPITLSFGQEVMIVGFKPRVHYALDLFDQLPNLSIIPGVGPTLNYVRNTDSYGAANVDANLIELGFGFGLEARYAFDNQLYVSFAPVNVDINFWRKVWIDSSIGGLSGTNSDIGYTFTVLAGVGYNF